MRVKARTKFEYGGIAYAPEDVLDAPDWDALILINNDAAIPWNLEDPQQRSVIIPPEPDVPPVTLSPTSNAMTAVGGTANFSVEITGEGVSGTWTVDKDAEATWLTVISPTTPQTASGTVSYRASANTGAERVAHMYINGQTFTVTQAGT